MSAGDWFSGKEGLPPKISLEAVYEGTEPKEIPSDFKPSVSSPLSAPPAKAQQEPPKPTPAPAAAPAAARAPPPSVNENKQSIAAMASKYQDNEPESSDDDETSSFEEVPKPVERPTAIQTRAPAPSAVASKPAPVSSPTVSTPKASTTPVPQSAPSKSTADTSASAPTSAVAGAAAGIKDFLAEIKGLLETQGKQLNSQSDQISVLTHEVNSLKARLGERNSGEKDEYIRQLELELEEARS